MKLTPVLPPNNSDLESLKIGLTNYNESFKGPVLNERIASFVKNDAEQVVGGVLVEINWNWLHIQGFWMDDTLRKEG